MSARAGVLGACALLLVGAAPAEGKKKRGTLGPVKSAVAVGSFSVTGTDSRATAVCPAGTRVVSGGFAAPYSSGSELMVTESLRSSPRSWSVAAKVQAGFGAVTAYAYCRRTPRPISAVTSTGSVPGGVGQYATVKAGCPNGAFAVSGGFHFTSGPAADQIAQPLGSWPGGTIRFDQWRVTAFNNGTAAQTLSIFAYCLRGIRTPVARSSRTRLGAPAFGSVSAASSCPDDKRAKATGKRPRILASLGFGTSMFTPAPAYLPIHAESRITGGVASDRMVNPGPDTYTTDAGAYAVCF